MSISINGSGRRHSRAATVAVAIVILAAAVSCIVSIGLLLWGLIKEGPAFYNGSECRMTYSHFQFLPLRVLPLSSRSPLPDTTTVEDRYRLLKFTDKRDPRHKHFYPISGSMVENYESQQQQQQSKAKPKAKGSARGGRLLELQDNWCLLPRNMIANLNNSNNQSISSSSSSSSSSSNSNGTNKQQTQKKKKWRGVPYPYRGHPVLYIPGHWGSFSQARSLGAHGTRWTGGGQSQSKTDQEIYQSLFSGMGINDGSKILSDLGAEEVFEDWLRSSSHIRQRGLDEFVMDVYSLDFNGQGGALHSSKLLHQAEFFARAVETIVQGCQIQQSSQQQQHNQHQQRGITIVAHSIGAWVVRIALKLHPHLVTNGWVRNVITLASPLGSVPYAVDAGVHDIARHINDVMKSNNDDGAGVGRKGEDDVTMISISGGLRDEMIPPEVCEVPTPTAKRNNDGDDESKAGIVSKSFLASSIMRSGDTYVAIDDGQFGMDHRAIVWCYDLVKAVREGIFYLVVASDQGLSATKRTNIAQRIMHGEDHLLSVDFDESQTTTSYQEEVIQQHTLLMKKKGYWRTVSIQLSAPYHVNLLLKLCIVAAMLHTIAIIPVFECITRNSQYVKSCLPLTAKCIDVALSLLGIPAVMLVVLWLRQSGQVCVGQECQLLYGTIFILSQLATLIYFLIIDGACVLAAIICNKYSARKEENAEQNGLVSAKSFRSIFLHLCVEQLRLQLFVGLPMTTGACFFINKFIHGFEDTVWNRVAFASYFFISFLLLILSRIIVLACKPHNPNFGVHPSELLVLFLALVKAAFGKMLLAFSFTTQWGQSNIDLYDNFLNAANSHFGMIGGHHNELSICLSTKLFPAFFALIASRTHDIMRMKYRSHWNGECASRGSSPKIDALNKMMRQYQEPTITTTVRICFVSWYTWNACVCFAEDDLAIPIISSVMLLTSYFRSAPMSSEVMNICSAILNNDLTLQCDDSQTHDKNK